MIFKDVQGMESFVECTPTNGDMIKAMFQVVGYTPLSTWAEKKRKKSVFHVHIQGEFKTDFRLTVSEDWWNAPYKNKKGDKE